MLILTNCLTEIADEGCLKVAGSFIKRIKKAYINVTVVSYERKSCFSDVYLNLNKLLLSYKLFSIVRKKKEDILYIPFPARKIASALRIFVLSLYAALSGVKLRVFMVLKTPVNFAAKILIKLSRAEIVVLSKDAKNFYSDIVGKRRVIYLKAGVDTEKFVPVSQIKAKELKKKYDFDENRPVILHVGHLNQGRNIKELIKLDEKYQILLITSTLTKDEQDSQLRKELLMQSNVSLIDDYIPNIEEIYQLSDVYFFPVLQSGHCIDVPLSCMEAASCNKPIVTTHFGEMQEFVGREGFYFIDSFESTRLNQLIEDVLNNQQMNIRDCILDYDWNNGISAFSDMK